MLKELEEKLKSLTNEDMLALADLLSPSVGTSAEEPIRLAQADIGQTGRNLIAGALFGRGDGVMSAKQHKAYEEAMGETIQGQAVTSKTAEGNTKGYSPGKDSTLILEWKARNKARQDETLKRLLENRKK